MAWRIELSDFGRKNLSKLDPQTRQRLLKSLSARLANLEDPRSLGAALTGSELGNFWKYRVGDYRVIADIQNHVMCILVSASASAGIFIDSVTHRRESTGSDKPPRDRVNRPSALAT